MTDRHVITGQLIFVRCVQLAEFTWFQPVCARSRGACRIPNRLANLPLILGGTRHDSQLVTRSCPRFGKIHSQPLTNTGVIVHPEEIKKTLIDFLIE